MTGRARGRARGRAKPKNGAGNPGRAGPQVGRGRSRGAPVSHSPPSAASPSPPGRDAATACVVGQEMGACAQVVGRGRSRGAPVSHPHPSAASPSPPPVCSSASLPQRMENMTVRESRPQGERAQRQRRLDDEGQTVQTRQSGFKKEGESGDKVKIVSNFFKLKKLPANIGYHQYHVQFSPDIQSNRLKNALINQFDGMAIKCFDGSTLILPIKLNENVITQTVTTNRGDSITITITYTCAVAENSPTIVHLMNVLFKKQLRALKMQLIGRDYFHPERKIEVTPHKLTIWPGYTTAILQYESDVMLCLDVVHKVLRSQTVLEFLYEIYKDVPKAEFYTIAAKKLIGEIVLTRYNNKTYRVDDIDWNKHPRDSFTKADGSSISFQEYYETAYDTQVVDHEQPLLISNPNERDRRRGMSGPILLLPELCVITGLSDDIRQNYQTMNALAQYTRIPPRPRVQNLEQFIGDLNNNHEAQAELKKWNMEFDRHLLRMEGRCLKPEDIKQKDKTKYSYKPDTANWSRESQGKQLLNAVNLTNWLLLYTPRDEAKAHEFYRTLTTVCPPMGMNVAQPTECRLNDDSARTYFSTLKREVVSGVEMVVCIVPSNRKDRYDAIKNFCCVERAVPSQVVISQTLQKNIMSVCTKIGIQLNCKLGGDVWAVDIPIKNGMVVGFDVYHDSLTKGKSVGGFVASTNDTWTKYYSRVTIQTSHQEICDQLMTCMAAALTKYHELNGQLPGRIIVYRDGVGDGQLKQVEEHEKPQFKAAFESMSPGYNPKFTMIIVKKRISTRLFMESGRDILNPPPGTVVDTVVTRPNWYDFYIVSQSVRQGSVTPTHYNVIHDSHPLTPDQMQRLTYKLCHLYYNWPGTIRVPAPCQYAHKLAFLIGQSIHKEPSQLLADRLYYL